MAIIEAAPRRSELRRRAAVSARDDRWASKAAQPAVVRAATELMPALRDERASGPARAGCSPWTSSGSGG